MSKSIVRLAFDGSVTCAAPPVRFQMIHESTVPNATSAVMSTDPDRMIHSSFVAEK